MTYQNLFFMQGQGHYIRFVFGCSIIFTPQIYLAGCLPVADTADTGGWQPQAQLGDGSGVIAKKPLTLSIVEGKSRQSPLCHSRATCPERSRRSGNPVLYAARCTLTANFACIFSLDFCYDLRYFMAVNVNGIYAELLVLMACLGQA